MGDTIRPTGSDASRPPDKAGEGLPAAAERAISQAARRLGLDPLGFAKRCADGQIADLIFDLKAARHGLEVVDRERVEKLLRSVSGLP